MPPVRSALLAGALILALAPAPGPTPASTGPVYSIDRSSPHLFRIDPETGECIDSVRISLTGEFPEQGNGLAVHPETGELWAVLRLLARYDRELVRLDPWTGVATSVGSLETDLAGLAFDAEGDLWGISGQSGDPPGTLCRIDMETAAVDSAAGLSPGRGHALAYNEEEEFFLHITGEDTVEIVSAWDLSVTPFPVTGHAWTSPKALTYAGDDVYYFVADGAWLTIDGNGVCDSVGVTMPTKGLALGDWTSDAPPPTFRDLALRLWPNPFRRGTLRVAPDGPGALPGPLAIRDVQGRLVRALRPGADGTAAWDGRDEAGRPVPAGVYFLGGRRFVVLR